jgi:putative DNA primase/helicase
VRRARRAAVGGDLVTTKPTGVRVDPDALARLLGVEIDEPDTAAGAASDTSDTAAEPVDLDQYPRIKAALDKNTGDRSADQYRVLGACTDARLTLAQARWVIQQRPDLAERLAGRSDDDVLTCWQKLNDNATDFGAGSPDHDDRFAAADEWDPPSAPLNVATRIYDQRHRDQEGRRTLISWRSTFMKWCGTHWEEADDAALRSSVYAQIGPKGWYWHATTYDLEKRRWNPDRNKVSNVMDALAAIAHQAAATNTPAWLGGDCATDPTQLIACRNGLLDLNTRTLIDHTPDLFNLVSVPFDYDPSAPAPTEWLKFLNTLWPDDQDSINLLQEWCGYILSGRTDMHKALLIHGPIRSGKGTIGRMLTALIGEGHTAAPTIAGLTTNFGLQPIIGKPLAIIPDARVGGQTNTIVERILSITGEDSLTIDRKYKEPWTGKLPTRIMMLTNELPRFGDHSGAIANRFLVLHTHESFLGREDRRLDGRIAAELPGVLLWCLAGLDRLNRNGRFTVPKSSDEAVIEMHDVGSPVAAFVRDMCITGPGNSIDRDDLYRHWRQWCFANGHESGAKITFGRNLRTVVDGLRSVRAGTTKRVWMHEGIRLRDADDPQEPQQPRPGCATYVQDETAYVQDHVQDENTHNRRPESYVQDVQDGFLYRDGKVDLESDMDIDNQDQVSTGKQCNSSWTSWTLGSDQHFCDDTSRMHPGRDPGRRPGCVCIGQPRPCQWCQNWARNGGTAP